MLRIGEAKAVAANAKAVSTNLYICIVLIYIVFKSAAEEEKEVMNEELWDSAGLFIHNYLDQSKIAHLQETKFSLNWQGVLFDTILLI